MADKKCRLTPFLKQCFVTSAVGINLMGHGCFGGYPAVLLPQIQQPESDIISNKVIDSWIASSAALSVVFGNFIVPVIMGRFGRKFIHYIVTASAILSWFITILAGNAEVILIARIIGGLSLGMMFSVRSILIGEYTSPKTRGAFLTTISLTQGIGIFFVHLIGSLISWRKTAIVCLFMPLTSFIMTFFMPESPSWLVSKGRYDECRKVFRWLRGDEEEQELEAMIQANFELKKTNLKKFDILGNMRKEEFYKPIILMVHVYAIGQFCGAAITASYATTIIKLVMNPQVNADLWMVVLDSERIVVNSMAILIINKIRRRTMLFSTMGLCIFVHLAIASYVYCRDSGLLTHDILWIPGSLMILHFFSIAVGMVPLPSVIAGEVFPLQYRSIAGAISLISISFNMFLAVKTFPALVESKGISGAYVVYACILTYCMIVIWFMLPETKGRTLQDIEDEYRGKTKITDAEEMKSLNDKESQKKDKEVVA